MKGLRFSVSHLIPSHLISSFVLRKQESAGLKLGNVTLRNNTENISLALSELRKHQQRPPRRPRQLKRILASRILAKFKPTQTEATKSERGAKTQPFFASPLWSHSKCPTPNSPMQTIDLHKETERRFCQSLTHDSRLTTHATLHYIETVALYVCLGCKRSSGVNWAGVIFSPASPPLPLLLLLLLLQIRHLTLFLTLPPFQRLPFYTNPKPSPRL